MKKLLLIICALLTFAACEKNDDEDDKIVKLAKYYELVAEKKALDTKIEGIQTRLREVTGGPAEALKSQLQDALKERTELNREIMKLRRELGLNKTALQSPPIKTGQTSSIIPLAVA